MAPPSANPITPAANGVAEISTTTANGTGDVERLVSSPQTNLWPTWSRDGRVLVYQVGSSIPTSTTDIWAMPMETRKPAPYIHGQANEVQPAFSPDGKWVAYVSDETGRAEIYVQPYPANGDKWTISTSGGVQPQWRSDGTELYFLTLSQQLQSVDVSVKDSRLDPGVPRLLFATRAVFPAGPLAPFRSYVVGPDGKSFLINEPASDSLQRHDPLTVIVNWTGLLRR